MGVAEQLQLQTNPFVRGDGANVCRPLKAALREVIGHIASGTPVVVVAGAPGTGKTLLVGMAMRTCTEMGNRVHQVVGANGLPIASRQNSDVLLIDEADSLTAATLASLLPFEGAAVAGTIVFFCLPGNVKCFAQLSPRAATVMLSPLTPAESSAFLLQLASGAGQPELFSPGAVNLLVESARGVPRVIRSIADRAYFNAAKEHSFEISARHVADALKGQLPSLPLKAETAAPPAAPAIAAYTQSPVLEPPPIPGPIDGLRSSAVRSPQHNADWLPRVIGGSAVFVASMVLAGIVQYLVVGSPTQNPQISTLPAPAQATASDVNFSTIPSATVTNANVRTTKFNDSPPHLRSAGKDPNAPFANIGEQLEAVPVPAPKPVFAKPKRRTVAKARPDTDLKQSIHHVETEPANRASTESATADAPPAGDPASPMRFVSQPEAVKQASMPSPSDFVSDDVGRQAELARIAADRARQAKETDEKRDDDAVLAARRAASHDSMRKLFHSLLGVNGR